MMRLLLFRAAFPAVALAVSVGGARAQTPQGAPVTVRPDTSTPATQVRGYSGFTVAFSMTTRRGAEQAYPVTHAILPGSPAEKAGFKPGDTILEVNGLDARGFGVLRVHPGERYTYRVRRGGEERELVLTAVPWPATPNQPRP